MTTFTTRLANLFSTDVVSVINAARDRQVFAEAIPMKASIQRGAQAFTHPLETSVEVTDHRVILPNQIKLLLIIPNGEYERVYPEINEAFIRADILEVQTRAHRYTNMIIRNMPHEESPERFDAITMELDLLETLFTSLTVVLLPIDQVSDATQASTTDRGQQNPQGPSASLAAQGLDAITGFFQ